MNTIDEEIGFLNRHLKEMAYQIGVLAAKQETAATTSKKLANELHLLREVQVQAIKQLREIETYDSGLYLWENIGEGG